MAIRDIFRRKKRDGDGMSADAMADVQRMAEMLAQAPPQADIYDMGQVEGREPVITNADVKRLEDVLKKYRRGKANLEQRIIENEQWYKMKHWEYIRGKTSHRDGDPEPTSAYLFNMLANKHADYMDNYPEIVALPREPDDQADAELLTEVLPVIFEQNKFRKTYSDVCWYKLKFGTGVYGIFFNARKHNGLGDIDIRKGDLLTLYWEPGVTDIQESRYLFHVDIVDQDLIIQQYPQLSRKVSSGSALDVPKYIYTDHVDTSDKTTVIDCYYKVWRGNREVLHYIKFCSGELLYASENDPACDETGFYSHGMYPYVFDVLFPEEGSAAGFGYIDVAKNPQLYIDKLDQYILKAAARAANQKFFRRGDGSVNEDEYNDPTKTFVTFNGSGDPRESIFPIQQPPVDQSSVVVRQAKIDELKETSGNRDFNQGGTTKGVTSGIALATLQEAGNKLSRDMITATFDAFEQLNNLAIKIISQFWTEDRMFRIIGPDGTIKFVTLNGKRLRMKPQPSAFGLDMGYREPIFDIKVRAQKSSPFSAAIENERAMMLYSAGFFRPDMADQALAALEMMTFEGVEQVRQRIAQNGLLYQRLQNIAQVTLAMAQELDAIKGTRYVPQVMQLLAQGQGGPIGGQVKVNMELPEESAVPGEVRARAAAAARPQIGGVA